MQVHKAAHDFLGGFFHKPDGLAVDPGDPEQPVQRQPDRGHEQDDGDPAEGRPRVPLVQQGMAGAVDGEPVHDGHEAQKDHRVRDEDQARNGQQREQERDVEHRRVGEKGLSWNLQPGPYSESAVGEEMRQAFLPCIGRRRRSFFRAALAAGELGRGRGCLAGEGDPFSRKALLPSLFVR